MLAAMKFKNYVWSNNPATFEVEAKRSLKSYKFPFSGYKVQDLGAMSRVIRGEGEFVGKDAYEQFRKLAAVFDSGGSGWLEHPVWQPMKVYFSKLKLTQEPKSEYVRYSFEFIECGSAYDMTGFVASPPAADREKYVSALSGEKLEDVAERYDTTEDALAELNPQISTAAVLDAGRLIKIS